MPKTQLSASGGHRPKEAHPIHNVPVLEGLPPTDRQRGEAALRGFSSTPELHQQLMDSDMDKTDSISNQFRKPNAQD